jgi:uncharacterized protein YacL (UPF0231 family)
MADLGRLIESVPEGIKNIKVTRFDGLVNIYTQEDLPIRVSEYDKVVMNRTNCAKLEAGAGLVNQRLAELHATNPERVKVIEAVKNQLDAYDTLPRDRMFLVGDEFMRELTRPRTLLENLSYNFNLQRKIGVNLMLRTKSKSELIERALNQENKIDDLNRTIRKNETKITDLSEEITALKKKEATWKGLDGREASVRLKEDTLELNQAKLMAEADATASLKLAGVEERYNTLLQEHNETVVNAVKSLLSCTKKGVDTEILQEYLEHEREYKRSISCFNFSKKETL